MAFSHWISVLVRLRTKRQLSNSGISWAAHILLLVWTVLLSLCAQSPQSSLVKVEKNTWVQNKTA